MRRIAPHWTERELKLLRSWWPTTPAHLIAQLIGHTPGAIDLKAYKLGLRKVDGNVGQFKPGAVPWNKGLHTVAGGRSAETRFKPGNRPHTWRPIGSVRVTDDGYLQRKVSDTGYPPRDWDGVHRLVWTTANGPIPPGHVVVFRRGRHTTVEAEITLDALELVTRRQLLERNSVHRYGPEIAQLIQLRGAINRQINKRAAA